MDVPAKRKAYVPRARCCQEPRDCFALSRFGNCDALEDTRFSGGGCPFYKPRCVFEREKQEIKDRLISLERVDLILRYKVD